MKEIEFFYKECYHKNKVLKAFNPNKKGEDNIDYKGN